MLRAAQVGQDASLDELVPGDRLLIIAPHPDDETLGCGMALAAACAKGREVAILLLTDGEGSHPNSREFDRESRVALRQAEFEAALSFLVPERSVPVVRAKLPDGRSKARDAAQIIDRLVGDPVLARMLADRTGANLWSFPVWGRFGERPVPENLRVFSDGLHRDAKRRAMQAYASQMTNLIEDDPDGFVMPSALFDHFATHPEIFFHER